LACALGFETIDITEFKVPIKAIKLGESANQPANFKKLMSTIRRYLAYSCLHKPSRLLLGLDEIKPEPVVEKTERKIKVELFDI